MNYESFQLQQNVRENCEDLKNTLKDLYEWEKEIKEKEKSQKFDQRENEKIPIIRSHASESNDIARGEDTNGCSETAYTNDKISDSSSPSSPVNHQPTNKELANIAKEKGNSFVKLGEYEQAIHHYDEAISLFDSDTTFYTNRALCFLRLEKYNECINDCNYAIIIDSKCIKAFYRRMQAYESLGEVDKSLSDCNTVLYLDPGNLDAKRSLDRIKKRKNSFGYNLSRSYQNIRDGTKILEPTWTQIDGYMKEISAITKPAHQRSKKPIKRVPVEDVLVDETHLNNIPNEVIDKLFNHNDCGSFKQVDNKRKKETVVENNAKNELAAEKHETPRVQKKVSIAPAQRKIEKIPEKPKTQAQFYSSWKELTEHQKYLYIKQIESTEILKILGAGFDTETLSAVLSILSEYYIADKCDMSILYEISKHEEMSILSLFLSDTDHSALKKVLGYMRQNGYDDVKIAHINKNFGTRY